MSTAASSVSSGSQFSSVAPKPTGGRRWLWVVVGVALALFLYQYGGMIQDLSLGHALAAFLPYSDRLIAPLMGLSRKRLHRQIALYRRDKAKRKADGDSDSDSDSDSGGDGGDAKRDAIERLVGESMGYVTSVRLRRGDHLGRQEPVAEVVEGERNAAAAADEIDEPGSEIGAAGVDAVETDAEQPILEGPKLVQKHTGDFDELAERDVGACSDQVRKVTIDL